MDFPPHTADDGPCVWGLRREPLDCYLVQIACGDLLYLAVVRRASHSPKKLLPQQYTAAEGPYGLTGATIARAFSLACRYADRAVATALAY